MHIFNLEKAFTQFICRLEIVRHARTFFLEDVRGFVELAIPLAVVGFIREKNMHPTIWYHPTTQLNIFGW